ncbi:hypothetical protein MATL_G00124230 [Megalops atlanticus]|uniref:FXYD domain-containing ion transport regulator n=1 Tax=Megalops atlanticus TaxID=7932 RepID=A0A9D3PYW5_MEGAT|nr:hypothetical protein MATL_G00124230 [Megalops atlanticus]
MAACFEAFLRLADYFTFTQKQHPCVQVVKKMGQFATLVLLAVFCTFCTEADANPFVYNYERLRIGGLVFACMLVAGGVCLLFWNKCRRGSKKDDDI